MKSKDVPRLAGQYSLSVDEYGKEDEWRGTCPKGERFCLFVKYLPNPLASSWKFFSTLGDALRGQDKLVAQIEKECLKLERAENKS
tara:strand:+ start:1300 stop:1557 length:258 start_codon:yes stop_codon:yes gene_type:complete